MTTTQEVDVPKVSVLGLGYMGATLARTFADKGCDVTVWNRTEERARALTGHDCVVASTPAEAIAASPLVVLCVLNEDAVDQVLASDGVAESLEGTTVANLTTESLAAGSAHAELVRTAGGVYLDGGILSYPRAIGTPEAVILYSGDEREFDRHASTLAMLAGSQRHVGRGVTDATVAYAASWTYYYGGLGGFFEAAAYAQAAGIRPDQVKQLASVMTRQLLDGIDDVCDRLIRNDFESDQADVDGHIDGIPTFVADARSAGVKADMLEAFVTHCRRAAAAGDGGKDVAVVVRALGPSD